MTLKPKTVETAFSTYTLGRQLGEGGTGWVYEAIHDLEQAFAIKLLKPAVVTTQRVKRFKSELFFCMCRVSHPIRLTSHDV